jgi:hypothetical protein
MHVRLRSPICELLGIDVPIVQLVNEAAPTQARMDPPRRDKLG